MENINHLPPQLTPKETPAIPAKAVAAASQELKKLVNLGQESVPPPSNLGKKIDLKV